MIDFQNASYVKLGRIDYSEVASQIDPLLIEGEEGFLAFKGMRDYIVFTSRRIIAVNVQGITGKKKDYTSPLRQGAGLLVGDGGDLSGRSSARSRGTSRRSCPHPTRRTAPWCHGTTAGGLAGPGRGCRSP